MITEKVRFLFLLLDFIHITRNSLQLTLKSFFLSPLHAIKSRRYSGVPFSLPPGLIYEGELFRLGTGDFIFFAGNSNWGLINFFLRFIDWKISREVAFFQFSFFIFILIIKMVSRMLQIAIYDINCEMQSYLFFFTCLYLVFLFLFHNFIFLVFLMKFSRERHLVSIFLLAYRAF